MGTHAEKQRRHFYRDDSSGPWSTSEWCDRYQIFRPTAYEAGGCPGEGDPAAYSIRKKRAALP